MAYIAPNSRVEFFKNMGLNNNFDDTLFFSSLTAKNDYFHSISSSLDSPYRVGYADALTYAREQRGFIRVELPMSTMLSASYMRYKNTSYENFWFYAFVKNVEYINDNCTQVNFEIDPMMTWMGVFSLNECFIERQHTLGDGIGANICGEGLDLGEYVCEGSSMTAFFGSNKIGLYKAMDKKDISEGILPYPMSQGTYAPVIRYFYPLDNSGITTLNDYITRLTNDNRETEVFTMKLVPEHWTDTSYTSSPPTDTFSVTKPYTTIAGYTPRNKKLFTYPFKYLQVENCEGDSTVYKYEYFETLPDTVSSGEAYFQIMGSAVTPEINIMCTPKNYKGEEYCWNESINMRNFPNVAWNVDGYKAYIAQRDSTIYGNTIANSITGAATGALHGAAFGGTGGATAGAILGAIGGLTSGMTNIFSDVINEMAGDKIPTRVPNETKGNPESNLMVQSNNKNFYFRRMCITKNYAMMIDSFFDMYGYAIRSHGTPNMNARPYWTYVKTSGCSVDGAIPADDASAIEKIFNHGVRFWKNHTHIGRYFDFDNRVQ